jgi:DNA mismatch endonuclease, patch repair protein
MAPVSRLGVVDPATRFRMSRVRREHTKPEQVVRQYLRAQGLQFRVNDKRLPGKPDIVLVARRIVVFVHGCFWHGHSGCPKASLPKTRTQFWAEKMSTNARRDLRSARKLRGMGWSVYTIWECGLTQKHLDRLGRRITSKDQAMK